MEQRRHRPSHPLARLRHERGVSQVQVAALAKCHPATVAVVEQGRIPSPDLARRLAAAVGATVEAIWPEEP